MFIARTCIGNPGILYTTRGLSESQHAKGDREWFQREALSACIR